MHASIIFFVTIFLFAAAQDAAEEGTTSSDHCSPADSWSGVLISSDVENCPDGERCDLVKGTNKSIHLTFTPKKDITGLRAAVYGIIRDLPVPFSKYNACEESDLTCPLAANGKYTFSTSLPVKSIYPQMALVVKWELIDDSDNVVVCKLIPVQIVKARKS